MELSIPSEESDSILAIPRRHFAEQGSWIGTVTRGPFVFPDSPHRKDPRRFGLTIATRLDPTFSADRIFFDPEPLLAALQQSHRREVYYLEEVVQPAGGLLEFSRTVASPLRTLLAAVRRHGIGLLLVARGADQTLVRPLRDRRDSVIITYDDIGYETLHEAVPALPEDALAATWYESTGFSLPGVSLRRTETPVIGGRAVTGVILPQPPADLLAACQAKAEADLEGRYREMLMAGVENSESE
jgi:hypothetical protein